MTTGEPSEEKVICGCPNGENYVIRYSKENPGKLCLNGKPRGEPFDENDNLRSVSNDSITCATEPYKATPGLRAVLKSEKPYTSDLIPNDDKDSIIFRGGGTDNQEFCAFPENASTKNFETLPEEHQDTLEILDLEIVTNSNN
jgi:hypothetical protein